MGALLTLSEMITLCKQNMGIRDLPKPVTDEDIWWRATHSALMSFSQIFPYTGRFIIGERERSCLPHPAIPQNHTNNYSNVYKIPKHYYQDRKIIDVAYVEIQRPNGYNDLYVPQGMIGDPASMLVGMASIQMLGSMARQMTHALTWQFESPDTLILYNGWTGGNYEVELNMTHDPTLSTLPPGTSDAFQELLQYDLEEFLYNKLKRVQNLDLGVGSVELKIDDWADSGNKRKELLKEWGETAPLDTGHILYF